MGSLSSQHEAGLFFFSRRSKDLPGVRNLDWDEGCFLGAGSLSVARGGNRCERGGSSSVESFVHANLGHDEKEYNESRSKSVKAVKKK